MGNLETAFHLFHLLKGILHCLFSLVGFKGTDFTTGNMFLCFPGGLSKWKIWFLFESRTDGTLKGHGNRGCPFVFAQDERCSFRHLGRNVRDPCFVLQTVAVYQKI